MEAILHDTLQYRVTYIEEKEILTEMWDGYVAYESLDSSTITIIFKDIYRGQEKTKTYKIPQSVWPEFRALYKRYKNYFSRESKIREIAKQVYELENEGVGFEDACEGTYVKHRVHFVAMNVSKKEFSIYAATRKSKLIA